MVYPDGGPAAVPCDVGRVHWAGLAFLSLSLGRYPLYGDGLHLRCEERSSMCPSRRRYSVVVGIDMTSVLLET